MQILVQNANTCTKYRYLYKTSFTKHNSCVKNIKCVQTHVLMHIYLYTNIFIKTIVKKIYIF